LVLSAVVLATLTAVVSADEKAEADKSATHLDRFATFTPAFTEDAIDFDACRQITSGKAEPVDFWKVRRTFGLIPDSGNWKDHQLTIPAGEAGKKTTSGFLFVFKAPVQIGALSLTPADVSDPKGSVNGGELFYVPGDAKAIPDPVLDQSDWKKVTFASPAQHLRFATFPKTIAVKALYYKDVRTQGDADLIYLNAYKNRLESITSAATGSAAPASAVKDAAGLTKGQSVAFTTTEKVSDKAPVSYSLVWKEAHKLDGVFLYSNADKFRLLALDPNEKDPAVAWKPIKFTADWDNMHAWESWHFNYRWLSFPSIETTALKVEITAVDGSTSWITGLSAITILKD